MSRRSILTLALSTAFLVAAGSAFAHHDDALFVSPVMSPEALRAAESRGLVTRARPKTPEQARLLELRRQRQQSFARSHEILRGEGLAVDRSPWANRRKGWRPPVSRRMLPSAVAKAGLEPLWANGTAEVDTYRVALLRIDFLADRGGSASSGNGRFDLTPPDTNAIPLDRAPHNRDFYRAHGEALSRYYSAMSYGQSVLVVDVWPAEQDSAYHVSDMADFGPWEFSQRIYEAALHMTRTMLFAADSQSTLKGDRIPWDTYDRVSIVHAGGDLQSDLRQDSPEDIPSFTIFMADSGMVIFPDSTNRPIDRVAFIPETINQDGYYGTINGVFAHETGHNVFGFADIYDISTGQTRVGYWSVMDSGNLVGSIVQVQGGSEIYATGLLPPSVDPFQRQFTSPDVLQFREPFWGDTMTVAGNERSPVMYYLPMSSDEYVLLENRYLAPASLVQLDQDSTTRVILGPKSPDRFEYDALMPGGGLLAWHIDESVIPFTTSLRVNPDFGWNTNPFRLGVRILEADGLMDLGDGGSPYATGSPTDPFQRRINPVLSDTTMPALIPNQGTRPHMRIEFLDDADSVMRFVARRTWTRDGWPARTEFPAGGPQLLSIDVDGDGDREICWAGGAPSSPDSGALFAFRPDGTALPTATSNGAFAQLDRRPLPMLAAVVTGNAATGTGPAVFAVTTERNAPDDTTGGKVWLLDAQGQPLPGWPPPTPDAVTTPPVVAGTWPEVLVHVGCADGYVRAYTRDGALAWEQRASTAPISGRLAFWQSFAGSVPVVCPALASPSDGRGGAPAAYPLGYVACGDTLGNVIVATPCGLSLRPTEPTRWPARVGGNGFAPDFVWLKLGGAGANADVPCDTLPTLVVRVADRLHAFCPNGAPLAGWGQPQADTLAAGLGAGDPDGDGFPEVLAQTEDSRVLFVNASGRPSPGWPKAGSREGFFTASPPVTADLDGDGVGEVIALNASGVIAAITASGRTPAGFPLATGSGCAGSMVVDDLDRDGRLEIAAPDRLGQLYVYAPPLAAAATASAVWPMVGGDPGRTGALPAGRTPSPAAAVAGPLERSSLKAYPNPARNRPVSFAYRLTEPAAVEYRILDASGHQVASFTRDGRRSDNVDVWDPGALPAGLYVAHLKFRGARGEMSQSVPVGLIR